MNLREFWAAEAAKLRDTSHLDLEVGVPDLLEAQQPEPTNNTETQKLVKLYRKESDAYNAIWKDTAASTLERYAWITDIGVLVMPLNGYTVDNEVFKTKADGSTKAAYVLAFKYDAKVKRCLVQYNNQWINVIASMHTHPIFLGQNVVSGEDAWFMNKTKVLLLVLTSDKILGMLPDGKTYARFDTDERKMLLNGNMQIKRDLIQIKNIIKQRTAS